MDSTTSTDQTSLTLQLTSITLTLESQLAVISLLTTLSPIDLMESAREIVKRANLSPPMDSAMEMVTNHIKGILKLDDEMARKVAQEAVLWEIAHRVVSEAERSPGMYMARPIHPEQQSGEIHLCDVNLAGAKVIGWKTKRIGNTSYKADGTVDPEKVPVFMMADEFKAKNQWDRRYPIKP